jgi:hypothetical protein
MQGERAKGVDHTLVTESGGESIGSANLLECPFCGSPCRTEKDCDGWPTIECTNTACYATVLFQNVNAGDPADGQRDYTETVAMFNTRHSNNGFTGKST